MRYFSQQTFRPTVIGVGGAGGTVLRESLRKGRVVPQALQDSPDESQASISTLLKPNLYVGMSIAQCASLFGESIRPS